MYKNGTDFDEKMAVIGARLQHRKTPIKSCIPILGVIFVLFSAMQLAEKLHNDLRFYNRLITRRKLHTDC